MKQLFITSVLTISLFGTCTAQDYFLNNLGFSVPTEKNLFEGDLGYILPVCTSSNLSIKDRRVFRRVMFAFSAMDENGTTIGAFNGRNPKNLLVSNYPAYPADSAQFGGQWEIKKGIQNHPLFLANPNYISPNEVENYPGEFMRSTGAGTLPFVDNNGDNRYVPNQGDYPAILGDHDIIVVQSTSLNTTLPGIEIVQQLYTFQSDSESIKNTLFSKISVRNLSGKDLQAFKMGIAVDFYLGGIAQERRDLLGTRQDKNLIYGFKQPGVNAPITPAAGIVLLKGEMASTTAMNNRYYDMDYLQLSDQEISYRLNAKNDFGNPSEYQEGEQFAFAGEPDGSSGKAEVLLPSSTERLSRAIMMNLPERDLADGEAFVVDIAFVYANASGEPPVESAYKLFDVVDSIKQFFEENNPTAIELAESRNITTQVYPNPASEYLLIKGNERIERVEIINLAGQTLMLVGGLQNQEIYLGNLAPGMYVAKLYNPQGEQIVRRFLKK